MHPHTRNRYLIITQTPMARGRIVDKSYVSDSRIAVKHLATLEPGISVAQTDEMKLKNVTLVVPKKLLPTYTANQRDRILSVSEFIELVNHVQSH